MPICATLRLIGDVDKGAERANGLNQNG